VEVGAPRSSAPVTIDDLAAAGLAVFADPTQSSPIVAVSTAMGPTPLRPLKDQADAMLLEAASRQGTLGADLDNLMVTADGMPPASYFLAGYVSAAGTPGAELARRIMGDQDWRHAPTVVFPSLVFTLFAADAARYANAFAGDAQASQATSRALSISPTLCTDAQKFIDDTINSFFEALGHLQSPKVPTSGIAFIDLFGSGLQAAFDLATGVVNGLIDAGRFVVVNGIKLATQPVLDDIAVVASTVALAAEIINVVRPWTVSVSADPTTNQRSIDPAAGLPGTFTAAVMLPGGFDEWPSLAVNCAQVANITLPPLKPVGAPVVWSLTQAVPLVTRSGDLAGVLDGNASASLAYTTVVESMTDSRGDLLTGTVSSDVSIMRKEIADAQKALADLIFAQIPGLLRPYLQPLFAPTLTKLLNLPAELLATHGRGNLIVSYHQCTTGDCCGAGKMACGTMCTDPMTDPLHCGTCMNACPDGQVCASGACSPPPTATIHVCPGGQCADYTVKGSCYENSSVANDCINFVGSSFTPESVQALCVVAPGAPAGATVTFSPAPCRSGPAYGCCLSGDTTAPGMEVIYCPYTLAIGPADWIPLCDGGNWIPN
jgi:hypothetical protein